jgi:hypothetical protein
VPNDKTALEKEIVDEIRGIYKSGFEGGGAFTSFPTDYYGKISDASEKVIVKDILMELLKDNNYGPELRCKVAWICVALEVSGAEDEIIKLNAEVKGSIYSNMTKAIMDQIAIDKQLIDEISKTDRKNDMQTHNEIYIRALALQRKLRGDVSKMYGTKDKKKIEKAEDDLSRYIINTSLNKILKSERPNSDLKAKVEILLADLNININDLRI